VLSGDNKRTLYPARGYARSDVANVKDELYRLTAGTAGEITAETAATAAKRTKPGGLNNQSG
jgi:hypothetical protein